MDERDVVLLIEAIGRGAIIQAAAVLHGGPEGLSAEAAAKRAVRLAQLVNAELANAERRA